MKSAIQNSIEQAINSLIDSNQFPPEASATEIHLERTKDTAHGDFACNIAMQLARTLKKSPREIATTLVTELKQSSLFSDVEVAGPGFINFRLSLSRYNDLVSSILTQGADFGTLPATGESKKVLIEFVSANPTGPLHVGHGRGAAYGATLANILKAAGQKVDCEYYVNDAGRQMDILALSVYLRYLEACDFQGVIYPQNVYQAEYCRDMAAKIKKESGDTYIPKADFFNDLPIINYSDYISKSEDLSTELKKCEEHLTDADKKRIEVIKSEQGTLKQLGEKFIDELIARAKKHLGESNYDVFFDTALSSICEDIKEDLSEFGVKFDDWYSEKSLFSTGKIEAALDVLREKGHLYEKNGALWFRTTDFGDEKDRVVQRDNGAYTYFTSDIAYHHHKIERGYDLLIDIFGADHHGYMGRVKAALEAFGHDSNKLHFELVQFAVLYKNGEKMQMSTRSGKYVTLRDLRGMIGNSAVRFFYVMRKPQQHMDFDLDLAVSTNKDNPLYYIQYAHARICQLFNRASKEDIQCEGNTNIIDKLQSDHEIELLRALERYSEILQSSAQDLAPHQLIHYLKDLATLLHGYYDAGNVKFLESNELQSARFALLLSVKQVLANGLQLTGVEAPERM